MHSALVILAPEADGLVGPFRERHDPSAALGMPAHVTILFPFKPELTGAERVRLARLIAGFPPFEYAFGEVRSFSSLVLYLAPADDVPFRELTAAVWREFPEAPPYGGEHAAIIPHLTVAHTRERGEFEAVSEAFRKACAGALPVRGTAREVALVDDASGRWEVRARFALGAAISSGS